MIFSKYTAYTMRMKKFFIILTTSVLVTFITAIFLCVQVLQMPQQVSAFDEDELRIVLDAGHGGVDGGVTGKTTGVKESDLNLAFTHSIKEVLEDMGFVVTLTRKTEAGLYGTPTKGFKRRDMQKRQEIIAETKPALVLSIHQNFYPSKSSRGGQVFYNKADGDSRALAEIMQNQINALYQKQGARGRKCMTGKYFILECSVYPTVIIECGFLSNAEDEKMLTSEVWREEFSHAIGAGVMQFLSNTTI